MPAGGATSTVYATPGGVATLALASLYNGLRTAVAASRVLPADLRTRFRYAVDDAAAALWAHAEATRDAARDLVASVEGDGWTVWAGAAVLPPVAVLAHATLRGAADDAALLAAFDVGIRAAAADAMVATAADGTHTPHRDSLPAGAVSPAAVAGAAAAHLPLAAAAAACDSLAAAAAAAARDAALALDADTAGAVAAPAGDEVAVILVGLAPVLAAMDAGAARAVLVGIAASFGATCGAMAGGARLRAWVAGAASGVAEQCRHHIKSWLVARDAAIFGAAAAVKRAIDGGGSPALPSVLDAASASGGAAATTTAAPGDALPVVLGLPPSAFVVDAADGLPEAFGALATADAMPLPWVPSPAALEAAAAIDDMVAGGAALPQLVAAVGAVTAAVAVEAYVDPAAGGSGDAPGGVEALLGTVEVVPAEARLPARAAAATVRALVESIAAAGGGVDGGRAARQAPAAITTGSGGSATSPAPPAAGGRRGAGTALSLAVMEGAAQVLRSALTAASGVSGGGVGSGWLAAPTSLLRALCAACARGDGAGWSAGAVRRFGVAALAARLRHPPTLPQLLLCRANCAANNADGSGNLTRAEFDATVMFYETTAARAWERVAAGCVRAARPGSRAGTPSSSAAPSRRTSVTGALLAAAVVEQGGERDADVALAENLVSPSPASRMGEAAAARELIWEAFASAGGRGVERRLAYLPALVALASDARAPLPPGWHGFHAIGHAHDGRSHAPGVVGGRRSSWEAPAPFAIAGPSSPGSPDALPLPLPLAPLYSDPDPLVLAAGVPPAVHTATATAGASGSGGGGGGGGGGGSSGGADGGAATRGARRSPSPSASGALSTVPSVADVPAAGGSGGVALRALGLAKALALCQAVVDGDGGSAVTAVPLSDLAISPAAVAACAQALGLPTPPPATATARLPLAEAAAQLASVAAGGAAPLVTTQLAHFVPALPSRAAPPAAPPRR